MYVIHTMSYIHHHARECAPAARAFRDWVAPLHCPTPGQPNLAPNPVFQLEHPRYEWHVDPSALAVPSAADISAPIVVRDDIIRSGYYTRYQSWVLSSVRKCDRTPSA